jgi:hypothetical protein
MDAAGYAHGESNLTTSNTIAAGNSLVLAAGWHQHQAHDRRYVCRGVLAIPSPRRTVPIPPWPALASKGV